MIGEQSTTERTVEVEQVVMGAVIRGGAYEYAMTLMPSSLQAAITRTGTLMNFPEWIGEGDTVAAYHLLSPAHRLEGSLQSRLPRQA
jgi:hypothetical protein